MEDSRRQSGARDTGSSIAEPHAHSSGVRTRRALTGLAVSATVLGLAPAGAAARALIRVVHAVPGVGRAQVAVRTGGGRRVVGAIDFGEATGWRSVASGPLHWSLSRGAHTLAAGVARLGDGAYDLVALQVGSSVRMGVYRARAGRPGTALVRVIHAAPELGSPQLRVDGRVVVSRLAFTDATPYLSLAPGSHRLAADRPGDPNPFVAATATVRAGAAYSVIVVGSQGQRVRAVVLVDRGPAAATRRHSVAHRSTAVPAGRSVVVRSGDSLWSIARRLSGPGASDAAVEHRLVEIWDANAHRIGTGDPNLLYAGTRLRV